MFGSKDLLFTSEKYGIAKSLRFRSSATAYLNRSPASAGNQKTWTWSSWIKLGKSGFFDLLGCYSSSTDTGNLEFRVTSGGALQVTLWNYETTTNAVFRDFSAWYHVVLVIDTTQAGTSSGSKVKMYVNGVSQTFSADQISSSIAQNTNLIWNSTTAQYIGRWYISDGGGNYLYDGYLAEVNFIDGQALTPSSFGAYDTNGVWQPAAYTGTYGTNGFYLKFTDVGATSGSNTGYGKDFAGTNYWTTNNFGTTSTATTYDSMLDSPTNATGDIGNYAVLNPLAKGANNTVTNANLTFSASGASSHTTFATLAPTGGKWYWEGTVTGTGGTYYPGFGIETNPSPNPNDQTGGSSTGYVYFITGEKFNNGALSAYGSTYTTNDVIGVAVDLDNGAIYFSKNNTWQNSGVPTSGSSKTGAAFTNIGSFMFPAFIGLAGSADINFGQRPFAYTPPSGFSALNTQNLTTPTITNGAAYMAAVLYTGTGSSQTITASSTNSGNNPNGTTFQPDLVWVKGRSGATDHALYDAVRGVQLQLESNTTTAETTETTGLTAFTSSGFTTGALAQMNTNTATYVAWEWNAGGSNATNTSGSITSTVRANTSAGFSVVTYTGTGANATVGHGLGVAPSMIIIKHRNGTDDWAVGHAYVNGGSSPWNYKLHLNLTNAQSADSLVWNNTAPSSSVFSLGTSGLVNTNTGTYVAYCFAAVAGYSAFGSYTGNGSTDGPFVYLGFRPRYVMIKRTDVANDWAIADTSRSPSNVVAQDLYADLSQAEGTSTSIDILSNGFKLRTTSAYPNASGGTYIYAAFAENPFKISRAR